MTSSVMFGCLESFTTSCNSGGRLDELAGAVWALAVIAALAQSQPMTAQARRALMVAFLFFISFLISGFYTLLNRGPNSHGLHWPILFRRENLAEHLHD